MKTKRPMPPLQSLTLDEMKLVCGGSPTLPLPPPGPDPELGTFKPGGPLDTGLPVGQRM